MKRKFYSTSEVAKLCSVHRNTIIAAIRQGKLPAFKTPGGHARIAHADLVRFCKERDLPISQDVSRNDKVLVFDSDPFVGKLLGAELEKQGYRVRVAEDAFEAGVLSVAFQPDVMVLDLEMATPKPEATIRRLRTTKATKEVLMIGLCASQDRSIIERASAAGLDELLERPFETKTLVNLISEQIGTIDTNVPIADEAAFEVATNR